MPLCSNNISPGKKKNNLISNLEEYNILVNLDILDYSL